MFLELGSALRVCFTVCFLLYKHSLNIELNHYIATGPFRWWEAFIKLALIFPWVCLRIYHHKELGWLMDSAPLSVQVCFHLQRTQPHLQGPETDGVHLLLLQNPGSERGRGGTFLRNLHLQHNQKCPSHPQRCVEVDPTLCWEGKDALTSHLRSSGLTINAFWISLITRWNQNFSKRKKSCVVGYLE